MKKVLLDAIVIALHIYSCFLLEKQICKSSKWVRPQDPVAGHPSDQMMRRFGDVLRTSPGRWSYMFLKFNSGTYLTYFDRLLETL